jgi:glutamine amidotransferase
MCRWLAYTGTTLPIENLVSKPANSLIHQSRDAAMGAEAVNADGFGVGWYAPGDPVPALFRSVQPAWADPNLEELARHIHSPLFVAHVRATSGTPVQQTNCHPFRHDGWLWAHNGVVRDFRTVKRDLVLAIDPLLYPAIVGSSDSEVLFHLALTFGLQHDPVTAVERMIAHVETVGHDHGVAHPLQMTVVTTDGVTVWAFRYSSERQSRSLFCSQEVDTVRRLHPEIEVLREVSDSTRIVVSEPLSSLTGAWVEVPESHYLVVGPDQDVLAPLAVPST